MLEKAFEVQLDSAAGTHACRRDFAEYLGITGEQQYKLSQFTLVKTIGRGTFGKVCLSLHQPSKTYHAMKILALRECTPRISRDFNEEYPKLRIFSHPNVLPVIGCCNSPPNLVVISQYMPVSR